MTAQPAYAKFYPFDSASGQQANQPEWSRFMASFGDGITNDPTGDAFHATASSGALTVSVALDELNIQGFHFEGVDATKTITIPGVATGYVRCDRIVAHYYPADKRCEVELLEGAPVLSPATPPIPALTQDATTREWMVPLHRYSGAAANAAALTHTDERIWLGALLLVPSAAALAYVNPSVGSRAHVASNGQDYVYKVASGGPAWVNLSNPPWTLWQPATGRIASFGSGSVINPSLGQPAFRLKDGAYQFRGTVSRLTGAAMGGSSAIDIGTLPPGGPLPDQMVEVPIACTFSSGSSGTGRLQVTASGAMSLFLTSDTAVTWVSLDDVSIPVVIA